MSDFEAAYGDRTAALAERLVEFETTAGNERPAVEFLEREMRGLGFETYAWSADADALAAHPSFPPAADIDAADRPSVGGVLELGDPERGPALVLNGHVDVVPAGDAGWTGDPFEPRWEGDRLVGRGAVDVKSQLAACVFGARHVADHADAGAAAGSTGQAAGSTGELHGRLVVEAVAGEEDGGIGAAAAALSNPYPFERGERVAHPLYDRFDVPWPVVLGRVEAGTWASNVPGDLAAECRVGVAPGESLDAVEREVRDALAGLASGDEWLSEHPPTFERRGVHFASAEIDPDEPVVTALRAALAAAGREESAPTGETYGSDARHFAEAGVPAVVFGPGRIEDAHFPDESVRWPEVLAFGEVLADAAERFLSV